MFTLNEIQLYLTDDRTVNGNLEAIFDHIASPEMANSKSLVFVWDNRPLLKCCASVIVTTHTQVVDSKYETLIRVDNPKLTLCLIAAELFPESIHRPNIGFGFVRDEFGTLHRMPHFGCVSIGDDVEIGRNTCIDTGVFGETIIGDGTKIDNLVHIAHNVSIGKNCLIVAGAIIGGSVTIGDNCFIGIGAMIRDGVIIGDDVTIGMGAVVINDVADGLTVVGNPAKILERK